jgi:deoxyribonuclease-4
MLIGAHVSTSGGLLKVLERAEETRSDAIQIFNQSPRMWKPTNYTEDDFAAFREGMEGSRLQAVMIHMIYLINPATDDREMRKKSLTSLVHGMRVAEGIGAIGVVVHPGALKTASRETAKKRAIKLLRAAIAETDSCRILYENTAGSPQLLGRDFDETAELIEQTGGPKRLGLCIDTCHLHVSGYDVCTPEGVSDLADEIDAKIGLKQLHAIHLNDATDPRGSNRDRHAAIGKGTIGRKGFRAFLSEPRFGDMPAVSETPGLGGKGPDREEVLLMRQLLREGRKRRNP